MKHLGVDWGGKRVGLATSDDEGRLAFPFGVRERKGIKGDVAELLSVVRGVGARCVVFGVPLMLEGQTPDAARRKREAELRRVAGQLSAQAQEIGLHLEIAWQDERNSTREVLAGLRQAGVSQKQARETGATDARSAAVILQAYLDRRNNAGVAPGHETPERGDDV